MTWARWTALMAVSWTLAEPAQAQPVGPEDRVALATLARDLPAHGMLPQATPPEDAVGDGTHDGWERLGAALLERFAPDALRRDERAALLAERPLAPAIARWVPTHRRYRALQAALAQIVRTRAAGQPHIRRPPYDVRVGVTAPEVASLRDRLLFEGYGDADVRGRLRNYFDPRLKRALWAWQKDHGLPVTITLDHLTRRRLNAPVPSPIAPLLLALQRWRALSLRADVGRHVLVDLVDYRLIAEEDGAEALSMRAIIGKADEKNRTPPQSSRLHTVVANPDWRVPRRIVDEGLRVRVQDVPELLIDEGYEVRVDHDGVWWVRKPPGPDNPLGRLKFQLERTRAVYLHDTSARDLFAQPQRALSHGCVRLQDPEALARWLLPRAGAELTLALEGHATTRFPLEEPVATHLVYQTTDVDPVTGGVLARPDVYGLDSEALAAIDVAAVEAAITAWDRGRGAPTTQGGPHRSADKGASSAHPPPPARPRCESGESGCARSEPSSPHPG